MMKIFLVSSLHLNYSYAAKNLEDNDLLDLKLRLKIRNNKNNETFNKES